MHTPAADRKLKAEFGAIVRHYRQKSGISQKALADRADMQRTYLADVERGARNMSLRNIVRLVGALEISLPKFFATLERSHQEDD